MPDVSLYLYLPFWHGATKNWMHPDRHAQGASDACNLPATAGGRQDARDRAGALRAGLFAAALAAGLTWV